MEFKPLYDRVAIEVAQQDEKTAGGIIIPDTAKDKPMQGKVVAVGSGAVDESGKLRPLTVKVNETVLFGKWAGTEIKIGDKNLLIVKESDILGIIG